MPSRASARGIWDDAARDAYRSAGRGVSGAYRNCVTVGGNTITINRDCLKKAGVGLKTSLANAWTD